MNKFVLACIMCAAIFVAPIAAAIIPHPEYFERENRRLWAFPDWPGTWDQKIFLRYFKGIDRFFPDRFPLRESLLELARTPWQLLGQSPDFTLTIRGKDDFLFIGNNGGGYHVECLEGLRAFTPALRKREKERLLQIAGVARAAGADFAIIIAPNKSSVYPECLPDVVPLAPTRFIQPFVDDLLAAGLKVYDPTERLRQKKSEGLMYFKTDTHWTMRGAFEAFEGFREYMGLPPLPRPSFCNGTETHDGDLFRLSGLRDYPIRNEVTETFPRWTPPLEKPVTQQSVLVFGDSFSDTLVPFFEAMFTDALRIPRTEFRNKQNLPLERRPTLVVWVNAERDFIEE